MTTLRSITQTIPPASDAIHFEIRRQVMRSHTIADKKRCEALLPYTRDIAPYSEATRLKISTYDQASALAQSIKRGKSFQSFVQRVKLGCLGSILEKVNSNPMILVKSPKRGNLIDALLKFIEVQLPFWKNSSSGYAKDEKDYTLGILNTCFNHDSLFSNRNMDLKQKWTMKVDSLGILDDVQLGFFVRVYVFGSLMQQMPTTAPLLITNEIVDLLDVEDLDANSDNEVDLENQNTVAPNMNLLYQNDTPIYIHLDISGNADFDSDIDI